ncbi:MAG: YHS domain-containing protein [Chitinophagaceae bacterium]|nr:YHS domain-containing protein [Chitinophagaceae bacterium]
MFTKLLPAIAITALLFSCGANEKKTETPAAAMQHHDSTAVQKPDFTMVHFDLDKDLSCGMPVKAGVEDTAHYKGKVYGFCAKECKEDFLKDPEAALAKK